MSQYERRRRSNVLSGDGSRLPNGGNTRVGRRGSGHLAAFSVCLGGRLDKTGTHANDGSRGEAVGKPGVAGVYTNQRLNLSKPWEDLRMTSQGFKPGSGNPTVRHYRGALGNVRHGETETPSCNRKSGNGNPSPTAGRAQFLSQPLYQQSPIVVGGGIFPLEKISNVPERPAVKDVASVARYWDKAARLGSGAYSAGVLMLRMRDGTFVVADVRRGQWSALDRRTCRTAEGVPIRVARSTACARLSGSSALLLAVTRWSPIQQRPMRKTRLTSR